MSGQIWVQNCLQRLSADDKSHHKWRKSLDENIYLCYSFLACALCENVSLNDFCSEKKWIILIGGFQWISFVLKLWIQFQIKKL